MANLNDDANDLLGLGLNLGLGVLDLPGATDDLESQVLQELPKEAKPTFLRSLGGLTPSESHDFCEYLLQLKVEKQFRVIQAMSDSPLEGKRKFLSTLVMKMADKQAREKDLFEQEQRDMEAHRKLVERQDAVNRVKKLNSTANKYHSFDAARGVGLTDPTKAPESPRSALAAVQEALGGPPVSRSQSSSAVAITKDDLREVSQRLLDTHITESEMNLRVLELHRLGKDNEPAGAIDLGMAEASKRDRPESSRDLVKQEQKPPQRKRPSEPKSADNAEADDDEEESESSDNANEPSSEDAPSTKRWTKLQDNALRESVRIHGEKNWKAIAERVPGRNHAQCLQRWRKVLKPGLVKGHWSFEEDQMLEFLVTQGCNNWGQIAERIPGRTPKQCRERWKNHLDPAINKGPYTEAEDKIILDAQDKLGNRWSQIAQLLKGRTEDSVKIRWKSLKQNPDKARTIHMQQRNKQHENPNSSYQQNAALVRKHQMELIEKEQQRQHIEAAQLEQQQQLQQHQLQMRLHERVMQQQLEQQQRAGLLTPSALMESNGLQLKPLGEVNSLHHQLSHQGTELPMFPSPLPMHNDHTYDYQNTGNFSYMAAMAASNIPEHNDVSQSGLEQWNLHDSTASSSVPLPESSYGSTASSAYWDQHYSKPHSGLPEPIPLTSSMLPVPPSNAMAYGVGVGGVGATPEDEVYNEPVMEKFATEFPIGGMGMGTM